MIPNLVKCVLQHQLTLARGSGTWLKPGSQSPLLMPFPPVGKNHIMKLLEG